MSKPLVWSELHPPRGLTLADLTAALRPLANRPTSGPLQKTPLVVFELRAEKGIIRWLLGTDYKLASKLPRQLRAQLPRLDVVQLADADRTSPELAADIKLSNLSSPLRLDTAEAVSSAVLDCLSRLPDGQTAVVQWAIGPAQPRAQQPETFRLSETLGLRTPTPDTATERDWKTKTSEPILTVRGRIGAGGGDARANRSLIQSVAAALALADSSGTCLRTSTATAQRAHNLTAVHHNSGRWSSVVSVAELATLLAFPLGERDLPGATGLVLGRPPASLLREPDSPQPIRIIGTSLHPASRQQAVVMPDSASGHHVHVVGPTGSGKSNWLAGAVLADVQAGHGVFVVEPRGDLIHDLLARIPDDRREDVVVIDPAGSPGEGVVGFNPLAGPPEEAERRADEMVGLFRNLYGSAIGPRSTDVLLHATLTVAKLPGGSLADIPVLLSNAVFRRKHLPGVSDPLVLGPWWAWFESMSEAERQQVTAPINNKLRAFLSRAAVRRLLAPDGSAFTLDDLFTKRRVVLVNLNAGLLGTEACRLLGSLLLSSFWSAAERRAAVPKEDRYPVRVVVDEFASYIAALDFDAVLALARGLGVSITVAHQNVAQLTASLLATVAANARSRVVFRPSPSDEKTLTALLGADVLPGDLARIGAFQAAARLYIDGEMTPTFTVQTLSLPDATTDPDAMRSESRRRYGTDGEEIDRRLLERWHGDSPPSDSPIGVRRRRTTA